MLSWLVGRGCGWLVDERMRSEGGAYEGGPRAPELFREPLQRRAVLLFVLLLPL